MTRRLTRALLLVAVLAGSALLVSGCASGPDALATDKSAVALQVGYPLTLTNCGVPLSVAAMPERVVTIKSSATELMLALGLGDRIIGSAFLDGPLPDSLAAAGSNLNVISDFVPGQEATLALAPDFIYGGWESNFSADGVGERAALAELGVGSYVSPAACKGDFMPDPLTFDAVFDEITEAGAIFGAPDAAAALVSTLRVELASLSPAQSAKASGGPSALWYSSGTTTPYVGAGIGSAAMIMRAAGLTNIFQDVHDTWTAVGWESIVEADPDVIVLVDASWNTAADKIASLEQGAATRNLTAVQKKRYIVLPFAATEAGIRNVEAAASTIDQLAAFSLD